MQSELKKGEVIVEVVLLARRITQTRHISQRLTKAKPFCKVRGITLNYSASQLVNFEKIKYMILCKDDEIVIVRTENKIKRKKVDGGVQLISEREDKTYRVLFLKGRHLNDNMSLPFGYINAR